MTIINNSYIQGVDTIVTALLGDHQKTYKRSIPISSWISEFRFVHIHLPRQVGKSVYLSQLANTLAMPNPTATMKVTLVTGMSNTYPISDFVDKIDLHWTDQMSVDLSDFETDIDVVLFDEIQPQAVRRILNSNGIIQAATNSDKFTAIALSTFNNAHQNNT